MQRHQHALDQKLSHAGKIKKHYKSQLCVKIDSLHQQILCWLHARFIPVHHSQMFICLGQLYCKGQNLVSLTAPSRGAQIVVLLWITSMSTYHFTINVLMISAVKSCVDPSQKVSQLKAYEQKSPSDLQLQFGNFCQKLIKKSFFWHPGVYVCIT